MPLAVRGKNANRPLSRVRARPGAGELPSSGNATSALLLAGLAAVLCGTPLASAAKPVPTPALSVRELLALSPQAVAELSDRDRSAARAQLSRALASQSTAHLPPQLLPSEARLPPAVQLPLPPNLLKVLALDLQRRAQRQEPLLTAAILKEAVKPLPAPDLLAPLEAPGDASVTLTLPADLLPKDTVALRRICERAALSWSSLLDHATVRLTAGVPFAVMLSMTDRMVYVNPVLLALVAPPGAAATDGTTALPIDLERELTYRSVADCAAKLQAGCRACVGGDTAKCAAMRGTFAGLDCQELGSDSSKPIDLCIARALRLRSVVDCVTATDPDCLANPPPAHCRDRVDLCIANPDAGADHADGGSSGGGGGGSACFDCTCAACGACNSQCADSCGQAGREMSRPCGESCADKNGQTCTESCNDCNKSCQVSCTQIDRDFGCSQIGRSCSQCSRDCASCNRQCNQCNGDCTKQCNQCNGDCAGCGTQCNQCSNQCNQCGTDCNQCGTECNQCGTDCNQCGNDCNQCNNQCNQCNGQCSVAGADVRYPSFPTPPGPAAPPPPLARMLVGARGSLMLMLPPLLFLWWRRRLHADRRQRSATPASP